MSDVSVKPPGEPLNGLKELREAGWIQAGILIVATIAVTVIVPILASRF
jgi:hypothetical protein